ncbi:MAG: ATP-dependent DNA ligase [Vicinamibacterales bacterium]
MLLAELVATSAAVAEASSRKVKISRLADLLQRATRGEVETAIAFLSGELRQGRIGIGPAAIREARPSAAVDTPALHLLEVDAAFERISATTGPGSVDDRMRLLRELLTRATAAEQDFLIRLLFGELRQGALEGVLVEAVARAGNLPSAAVRRAVMMAGALAPVARAVLIEGENTLSRFVVQIFRPVQPMLAQTAAGVDEALAELDQDVALEWKLDGARIQVHKSDDDIKVFSRNLRDVTFAVPEVVEAARNLAVNDVILDGEVIALRPDGTPQTFQQTMQRFGRKLDVDRLRGEIPLTPFFFDCLYADGASLIDLPQAERFRTLAAIAPSAIVPNRVRPTPEEAARFVEETLSRGHEGVMVKALASGYAAGRRGQHWLKIKVARTLDLVVLAAEWGHGRRRGWLSNLHLGARDPVSAGFVMLGKTFKGMTDQMLAWQTERLLQLEIARDDYTVYVRPEVVVEVAFNDLQESPHYPGGLALRFARVKSYRPDKPAAKADTIETVRGIYRQSTGREPPVRPGL